MPELEAVSAQFVGGQVNVEVGDDVPAAQVVEHAGKIKGLLPIAEALVRQVEAPADSPLHLASAVEFVLEALHVHDKLSKFTFRERTYYRK
jgi:hypothetical protein